MPTCIICHLGIIEGLDSSQACPNGHLAHTDCLKEWVVHSLNCPLCREPYPEQVIQQFKEFINQKETEQQAAMENELKQEEIKLKEKELKQDETKHLLAEIEKLKLEIENLNNEKAGTEKTFNKLEINKKEIKNSIKQELAKINVIV